MQAVSCCTASTNRYDDAILGQHMKSTLASQRLCRQGVRVKNHDYLTAVVRQPIPNIKGHRQACKLKSWFLIWLLLVSRASLNSVEIWRAALDIWNAPPCRAAHCLPMKKSSSETARLHCGQFVNGLHTEYKPSCQKWCSRLAYSALSAWDRLEPRHRRFLYVGIARRMWHFHPLFQAAIVGPCGQNIVSYCMVSLLSAYHPQAPGHIARRSGQGWYNNTE